MRRFKKGGSLSLRSRLYQRGSSLLLLFLALMSSPGHTKERSSVGTHIHGLSTLTIAMESETVEIQLTSPIADLVGFEYKARSVEDLAMIDNMSLALRKHESLFLPAGGECEHLNTMVDMTHLVDAKPHHLEHDTKGKQISDKEHHREIVANYRYHCRNPEALSSVKVPLFGVFPRVQRIQVMWIGPLKQGATILTSKNSLIEFN